MPPGYEPLAGTVITRTYARTMVISNRHTDGCVCISVKRTWEAKNYIPRFIHDKDCDAREQVLKITQGSTRLCFRHHISAGTIEFGSNRFMVILNARYPVPGMSNA